MVDVIEDNPFSDGGRAFGRLLLAEADAEERGFACAIAADDAGAFPWSEREIEMPEEPAFIGLEQHPGIFQFDRGVSKFGRGRNEEIHLALLGRRVLVGDFVEGFEAVLGF